MSGVRALLSWLLALPAIAATAAPTLPQDSPHGSVGVASCASSLCHGSIAPWKNSHVLQTEYVTWSRRDRHARAYSVLLGERSAQIARRLGLAEPPQRAAVCLDCHAHNVPAARRGRQFVLSDGVTCEACHGPAKDWITGHVEPDASHARNLARGMYPVDDDGARARLCLSCHFGTTSKFVTHKLLGAGHPRLSFELDTFMQIEPPHVRREGAEAKRTQLWHGVRAWAVGQAVAADALLSMLVDPRRGRDGLFPELALFDCYACHHRMAEMRDSAARIGAGPGIVRLNDSSLLMLRQIVRRIDAGRGDALAAQVARLQHAVAAGDDALAQARITRQMIEPLSARISQHRFSADDLRAMLVGLIDDGLAGQYSDYPGAEQAAMALQSIADFMVRRGLLEARPLQPALDRMLAVLARDEAYRPQAFEQALRELRAQLVEAMPR